MTRTISLIIGITVLALAAVPAAFGEGRLAGLSQQDGITYFRANELTTLARQPVQVIRRTDAFDRTATTLQANPYRDAADRVVQPKPSNPGYVDASQRGTGPVSPAPTVVSSTSSGTDIDWAQLGIGLGIGIALAFGLMLMLRPSRRLLAH